MILELVKVSDVAGLSKKYLKSDTKGTIFCNGFVFGSFFQFSPGNLLRHSKWNFSYIFDWDYLKLENNFDFQTIKNLEFEEKYAWKLTFALATSVPLVEIRILRRSADRTIERFLCHESRTFMNRFEESFMIWSSSSEFLIQNQSRWSKFVYKITKIFSNPVFWATLKDFSLTYKFLMPDKQAIFYPFNGKKVSVSMEDKFLAVEK